MPGGVRAGATEATEKRNPDGATSALLGAEEDEDADPGRGGW